MKKSLLLLLLISPLFVAGQPRIDSLKSILADPMLTEVDRITTLNLIAYWMRFGNLDEGLLYAEQALKLAEANSYARGVVDAKVTIGIIFWLKSIPEKGIEEGWAALQISDSIGYEVGKIEANLLLSSVYRDLDDIAKADEFTDEALRQSISINYNAGLIRAHNAKGNYARARRDEVNALKHYEAGVALPPERNSEIYKSLLLLNISLHYIERDIEREKTKKFLDDALHIAFKYNNKSAMFTATLRFGQYYSNLLQYAKAEEYYSIAGKMAKEIGMPTALVATYQGLIDVKLNQGHYKEAHTLERSAAILKDSIFKLERARQLARLQSQHETEKKEQTIKILEQEKKIQSIRQTMLIGGVVILSLMSVIVYRLERSRTLKARKLLDVQKILNDKLTELDKLRSGFFAHISHEFRTPLTLILAPLENEIKKRTSAEGKESLYLIRRSACRLLELVNQLLDLSKLESGKMDLRISQGDLTTHLTVIAATFKSLAEHKHITFDQNLSLDGQQAYWYDGDKMEKIVTNLLGNAFKFTPPGGRVSFSADCNEGILRLIVADNGVGIAKEEQSRVFSPFYQNQNSVSSLQLGSGLGLSVVKELVKLYNGEIELQSDLGEGATFVISLPVNRSMFSENQIFEETNYVFNAKISDQGYERLGKESLQADIDLRNAILVAEDNPDMRHFIASSLENEGYSVITAADGHEARQLALRHIPSLIVSDVMMPKIDGIELTKMIRSDERTSHIPVVLLTARNDQESKLLGLNTGADDYLTKPFSPAELLVRINNLIGQRKTLQKKFLEKMLLSKEDVNDAVSLDEKFINRLRTVVEQNISDHTLSIEKLADEMQLSKTQLLRKLRDLVGKSPSDFIKDIRIRRAAEMITHNVATITHVSYSVGFNDQSYFAKCFKKQFGTTPTQYAGMHSRLSHTVTAGTKQITNGTGKLPE
jgi:signal transduction histidine kinase/DNA-binding response OmpR family regulator